MPTRPNKTDLNQIRKVCKALFDVISIKDAVMKNPLMPDHPFVTGMSSMNISTHTILNLSNDEDIAVYREQFFTRLDTMPLGIIFSIVTEPYKLTWFKHCCSAMNEQDFGEYLSYCWTGEENPNQDVNVSRKTVISYFRKAKKQYLMDDDELSYYDSLPKKITVYRGVAPRRERLGLSWTDDLDKATWFAHRYEKELEEKGHLLQATIPKSIVLAYFNPSRQEVSRL